VGGFVAMISVGNKCDYQMLKTHFFQKEKDGLLSAPFSKNSSTRSAFYPMKIKIISLDEIKIVRKTKNSREIVSIKREYKFFYI